MAYMIVEVIIGAVCIMIYTMPFAVCFILQFIPLAAFIIAFYYVYRTNGHTAAHEAAGKAKFLFIKTAALELNNIWLPVQDRALSKKIESVYDAIRSANVRSTPNVGHLENEINSYIQNLKNAVHDSKFTDAEAIANHLLELINERNNKIQLTQ